MANLEFYSGKAWRHVRKAYMTSKHYQCERCGGPASIVHHRIPITAANVNDVNVTLSWSNLEALCLECHNKEHLYSSRATADGISFDADGNVVYTPEPPRLRPPGVRV